MNNRRTTCPNLLVALMAGALLSGSCDSRQDKLSAIEDHKQVPTLEIDRLQINYTENGLLRMHLEAPLLQRFLLAEEPYNVFPEGMHVYFYTAAHELENEIIADYAYNREKPVEYWEAIGNVVVKNHLKQQTLYTDTLYWDRAKKNIYTHAPVRIVTPDLSFDGLGGMVADERFEGYKFFNANNGILYVSDEPATQDSVAAALPAGSPAETGAPQEAEPPQPAKRARMLDKQPAEILSPFATQEKIQEEIVRP
ncbi:MAG: LPS export ABC transporter periplasmic protein LptC [Prevotellaceae bacterium]|jgi:LPS export ABC transporter protein LptC|nr:LPS export ABC transporter periplasmic protein LptC [Prevotellaceae bacterium]